MDIKPLRRNYGFSFSTLAGLSILFLILLGLNALAVFKLDIGENFYSNWYAGRILFAQGENPYANEVFEHILAKFPYQEQISGFTMPLYAVIFALPFSFVNNFQIVLIIWMSIIEAAIIFAGIRIVSAFRLESKLFTPFLIAFALSTCYFSIIAILEGDIGIVAFLFLVIAIHAIQDGDDEFAGILLAFATIKFSLTLLPILWIFLWTLGNRRSSILGWFMITFSLLVLLSILFMPNWITEFSRSIIYYYKYLYPLYFSRVIELWQPELGGRIGWAISGFFGVILLIEWIVNARNSEKAFLWVLALTLTINYLVGIPNLGKNLYFLWLPLFYALDQINLRWVQNGKWFSIALLLLFCILPWVNKIQSSDWMMPITMINLFFPIIVFLLLYWNRWWTIDKVVTPY